MSRGKWFTKEEDLMIINIAKRKPFNLKLEFKKLAKKLNRSYGGVSKRWYTKLSLMEENAYCFMLLTSNDMVLNNRKIYVKGYKIKPKKLY